MSVNKAIALGKVGYVFSQYFNSGGTRINFHIETIEEWIDRSTQELRSRTESISVSIRGKAAEVADQLIRDDSCVFVEGRLTHTKQASLNGSMERITQVVVDDNHGYFVVLSSPRLTREQAKHLRRTGVRQ